MTDSAAVHPPGFLAEPTRFLFFTGKGGVGKTSIACAAVFPGEALGLSIEEVKDDLGGGRQSLVPFAVTTMDRFTKDD